LREREDEAEAHFGTADYLHPAREHEVGVACAGSAGVPWQLTEVPETCLKRFKKLASADRTRHAFQ
jgi:hypothetical protein